MMAVAVVECLAEKRILILSRQYCGCQVVDVEKVESDYNLSALDTRKYDVIGGDSRANEMEAQVFRSFYEEVNQMQRPGQGPISSTLHCSYADRREIVMFDHH